MRPERPHMHGRAAEDGGNEMRKTRILALLLALLSAFPTGGTAQERQPLRTLDVDKTQGLREAGIPTKNVLYDPWGDLGELLQSGNAPDLLGFYTVNNELAPLYEAGLLADLSENEEISQAVERMTRWARQLVTTPDGQIFAMPVRHSVMPFCWNQDAWDAAGLAEEDAPRSYTELLDFLERWCGRVEQSPEKDICVSALRTWNAGAEKYHYCWWLMEMLLDCWELQCRYAGEKVVFDTPEFAELSARTVETALRLYKAEPSERKRQKMKEVFTNGLRGGSGFGMEEGLSHAVPMRITSGQPMLVKADALLWCVRSGSAWYTEAAEFIAHSLESYGKQDVCTVYGDFPAGTYGPATVTQKWLDDYRAYEGELVYFASVFYQSQNSETDKESLMMKLFQGKISAEAFARMLDELLAN